MSARHNSIGSLSPGDVEGCNNLDQLELGYNRLATLTGTFEGLSNLVKLGLIGNELACIDMQALDSLHRVREVEVDLRYLQCSCANNFVRDWMLQRRAKVVNYNCQTVSGSCPSASQLSAALSCPVNPPCPEGCSCKVGMSSFFLTLIPPTPSTLDVSSSRVPDKPSHVQSLQGLIFFVGLFFSPQPPPNLNHLLNTNFHLLLINSLFSPFPT